MKVITKMLLERENSLYSESKRNGVPGEVDVTAAYASLFNLRGSASPHPDVKMVAICNRTPPFVDP